MRTQNSIFKHKKKFHNQSQVLVSISWWINLLAFNFDLSIDFDFLTGFQIDFPP